jgi:GTPase SAR1 family protein
MKVIHGNGFTEDERKIYVAAIHSNVLQGITILIQAAVNFDLKIRVAKAVVDKFLAVEDVRALELTPELAQEILNIWDDSSIMKAYKRRNEFQLFDGAEYFIREVVRLASPDFVPNDQDILVCRIQTTGIIETEFLIQGRKFIIVDVGGQRSERKKWINCFEDVTAVLFVVGMSEFDKTLYEDNVTNRIHEALKLFKEICTSKWFSSSAIILFMNKSDLFQKKLLEGKSITTAFPEYTGGNEFEESAAYMEKKFTEGVVDPVTRKPKTVYTYITCATDAHNIRKVFNAVQNSIVGQSLQAVKLV